MKKMLLACMLTTAATVPTLAAETASVSLAIKQSITQECIQDDCKGLIKGNVSWNHTIDLTPQEESALQEDTSVTLLMEGVRVDVRLGDDPNFNTGDTSAKLTTAVDVSGQFQAQANVQLKWGNGQLKIKLSLPFSANETVNEMIKAKEPNALKVFINAVNGAVTVFEVEKEVTGVSKQSGSIAVSAEGDEKQKLLFSFKSQELPV
jgi:hypothetical protein